MSWRVNFIVFTLLASDWHFGDAARILAVLPTASVSHQVVFQKLMLELNKRGHELVVVTPNPVNDPTLKNYTEIDISFQYSDKDTLPNIINLRGNVDWFGLLKVFEPMLSKHAVQIFEHPELKKLYDPNSGEEFDLILMQMFITPAFMSFAARFKAPMIGIVSASLQTSVQYAIGNPILHSDPSNWQLDMKSPGSSWIPWRRLDNFIQSWRFIHYHRTVILPKYQKIAEKYLGIDIPDLHDLEKNVSLIFVNQQGPISFAKPNVPKVIEIGGFHVADKIKPLPKDLKKVLDEATQGFVYMSLGSNIQSNMLPEKARKDIVTAFSKLPYTVIWKFEDDTLKNLPENVIILKWTPQQAVLAHPNIKVFIYQGGLQSTEEAVSNGVPLIGLPVMSDQDMNVRKMVSVGVAKMLEITNINEKDFFEAVRTVAGDDGYKQRMLNLRSLLKDKPYDMLENAVWWTEHVIRHRGAPHLHSTTADEPWYQRQDMDIIAFLSAMFVILSILSVFIFYKCVILSIRLASHPTVEKSKKRNSMEVCKISSNMPRWTFFTALMLLGCGLDCGDGARILSIFPAPSISHQSVFRKLTLELNKRGHELVVVTTDPIKDSTLKNYKEIDISFLYKEKNYIGSVVDFRGKIDWYSRLSMLETIMSSQVTQIFSFPEFKKLYEPGSGEKFDLVLMEIFFSPAFMALAERFKAPLIGIASANLQLGVQYGIGDPILPSHPSILEMNVKGGDSWIPWQRLQNFIYSWRIIHYYRTVTLPKHKELAEKYLGIEIKDLHEMEKNISLIFVNQQKPISFVRPNVPKVIEIGGFHVSDKSKPLPKDLQKTLDEATQGFIYMSLGSNIKSNTLSKKTRDAFITAFSELSYKVIWKFENDELEGKPDNVIILKWAPQQAILAHPNIKLFVYQGGLQSTEEAVSHGVPLVGLPVMGDQDVNVNKMVSLGVAKKLEITDITKDDLLDAINTVARNASYKQKMMNLRSLLKDKPQDSLKSAVWWTEHVIRHGGAPHLHSTTAEEPWYQRQDMDIIAFLSAAFVITLILTNLILYKCVIYSIRAFAVHSVDKKKKRS
ncbi:uncharacterized protein LOC107222351 [Neodiprion lecontei]|uniref:Uncharacterized protein LOC107222351 n=1 Tax=Neodiprion lecontei TaxID=441921 RepID=A0ABM3GM13_NEOLC|nr:uncharacterized protein LOC107222351 [Neodiprion lecontei]